MCACVCTGEADSERPLPPQVMMRKRNEINEDQHSTIFAELLAGRATAFVVSVCGGIPSAFSCSTTPTGAGSSSATNLYSYGLYNHGLYTYDLYGHGLYSCGLYSEGLYYYKRNEPRVLPRLDVQACTAEVHAAQHQLCAVWRRPWPLQIQGAVCQVPAYAAVSGSNVDEEHAGAVDEIRGAAELVEALMPHVERRSNEAFVALPQECRGLLVVSNVAVPA